MRHLLIVLAAFSCFLLSSCGGDSGSSSAPSGTGGDKAPEPTPSDSIKMTLQGAGQFSPADQLQLSLNVKQLKSDSPVYVNTKSDAIELGTLSVSPQATILNPQGGEVQLNLQLQAHDLVQDAEVTISLRTADNQLVEETITVTPNN